MEKNTRTQSKIIDSMWVGARHGKNTRTQSKIVDSMWVGACHGKNPQEHRVK